MSALIEQRRARFALNQVAQWKEKNQFNDKFEPAANSLPALILMNGLGQAAAYCKSQNPETQPQWRALYKALSHWLCGQGDAAIRNPGPVYPNQDDLLAALTHGSMADYRIAQAEALAFLQWLKNAVRAEMAGGPHGAN